MKLCPDKNNDDYKKLVDAFGSKRANTAFYRKGDGSIPSIAEAEKILGVKAGEPTAQAKKYDEWLKEEPITRKSDLDKLSVGASQAVESAKEFTKKSLQEIVPTYLETENFATQAEVILRENLGKTYRINEIADKNSAEILKYWNKKSFNEQMRFIDVVENPKLYDLSDRPDIKKLADLYRKRLDKVYDVISGIKDVPYYEDYFPHLWKQPEKARTFFSTLSKRPFEGSKSFLKQRFYQDIKEGMAAKLELITTNPEELVRISEMNATKFKMAHDVFNTFKDRGMLKYVRSGDEIPEGWALVKDKMFERMAPFAEKVSAEEVAMAAEEGKGITPEAAITRGGWYMPEDATRIVNNYLSRGLAGNYWTRHAYKLATSVNNLFNMVQLGFSQFHLVTTSLDASVTTSANGLVKLLSFKKELVPSALSDIAKGFSVFPAVAENYAKSNVVRRDFYDGKMPAEVQAIISANGRMSSEKQWQINAEYSFDKAFNRLKQGELSYLPSAVGNGLASIIEITAKPAMKYNVPAMKIGGFLRTVETELAMNPNMTEFERTKLYQRTWDMMDDRLGQVVYDNLFWDKTLKDLSFMTIRSFGWTGGTIRAIGKGIRDIPKSAQRAIKGQGIEQTTAWLASLGVMVGAWGGIYHYLMTGNKPEELKDYFYPKDGTKNPDGTDRRVALPTYIKDIGAYYKKPYNTLWNKTSPFINIWHDVYANADFYKQPIRDEEDPFYKQGLDVAAYGFKTIQPFAFKQQPGEELGFFERLKTKEGIESQFGIIKAPSELTRTDLEEKINEQLIKEMDKAKRTEGYKPEESVYKKIIAAQIREGKKFKELSDAEKRKAGLVDEEGKIISPEKVKKLVATARLTPAQRSFKFLTPEGQLTVLSKLDDTQVKELLSNRRVLNITGMLRIAKQKPEFFKTEELKKAYKVATKRDYREREEME